MDQNEKLGAWGIYFLAAIDAYSRYPLVWLTTTSLRGIEHSRLYHEMLRLRGEVRSVCTGAWCARCDCLSWQHSLVGAERV